MRGSDAMTGSLFSYVDIEARILANHPIRTIRRIVNEVLTGLDGEFAAIYSGTAVPQLPPNDCCAARSCKLFSPSARSAN
jgi:hypothetical protein